LKNSTVLFVFFLLGAALLFCPVTNGLAASDSANQDGPHTGSARILSSNDPNEAVLKFQKFLSDEAKNHRDFLESFYAKAAGTLAFIGIIFGGILTWLNWRSKEDIRKQVNEQFKETVSIIIREKLAEVDKLLRESRDKSDAQFQEINKLLLDLSQRTQAVPASTAGSDVRSLSGKKILWVDDHPRNNDYPRQILAEAGISFTNVLSTEDALRELQKEKYDLIISDMGRGSNHTAGLELIQKVKELSLNVPIVIYASSRALQTNGPEARRLGAIAAVSGVSEILREVQMYLLLQHGNPSRS
jgi:CheY-like chemotaxis protein